MDAARLARVARRVMESARTFSILAWSKFTWIACIPSHEHRPQRLLVSRYYVEDEDPTICDICGRDEVLHKPCRSFERPLDGSDDELAPCENCGLHEEVCIWFCSSHRAETLVVG
jgi:hypothetical protein